MINKTSWWIGAVQAVFYGATPIIVHNLITLFASGGMFNGLLPWGLGGIVTIALSIWENSIQDKTGKALFGMAA